MLLTLDKVENHSRGVKGVCEYSVVDNGKIMEMLSKQVYSEPIKAICREIFTNAREACIGLDNEVDFEVTLPSKDSPEMRIKDWGCGMSPSFIINNYSTYGKSFKDKSNDFSGCYGLGSKSIFARSNSFTTTSCYDGTKCIYVNTKYGDNGKPCIKKIHEESTNEPNGVEISFAVNLSDIPKFVQSTAEILHYFPKKFKVIDDTNLYDKIFQSLEREPLFQGNGWTIFDGMDKPVAIMGYIAYPIKRSILNHVLLGCNIEIDFEIGELGVNIGREELEYTPQTTKCITEKLEKIHDEVLNVVRKDIDECECFFDACLKYKASPYYLQRLLGQVKYKGRQLDTYLYIDKYYCQNFYKQYGRTKKSITSTLSYNEKLKFIINDVDSGSNKLLTDILDSDNFPILSIKVDEKDAAAKDLIIKDICERMGIPETRLIYLSTIKNSLPKVKRTYSGVKREISTFLFKESKGYGKSGFWTKTSVDLSNGGLYVPTTGYDILIDSRKIAPDALQNIFFQFKKLGIAPPPIYGLRPTHVKKIQKDSKWTLVTNWIQQKLDNLNTIFTEKDIIAANTKNKLDSYIISTLERICKDSRFKCDDLKSFIKDSQKKNANDYRNLNNVLDISPLAKFQRIVKTEDVLDVVEKYDVIFSNLRFYGLNSSKDADMIKLFNAMN